MFRWVEEKRTGGAEVQVWCLRQQRTKTRVSRVVGSGEVGWVQKCERRVKSRKKVAAWGQASNGWVGPASAGWPATGLKQLGKLTPAASNRRGPATSAKLYVRCCCETVATASSISTDV